jgi:RHS repeat-associated protein
VWYEGSGTTNRRFLQADQLGSVVAVSDGSGAMLAINRYDEYGIPQAGNVGRFQYTGQTWYGEVGLYNYKARWYSPTLGRFLQTDPIGYKDQLNLYAYVGNDPVNGRDPTGMIEGCYWGTGVEGFQPLVCNGKHSWTEANAVSISTYNLPQRQPQESQKSPSKPCHNFGVGVAGEVVQGVGLNGDAYVSYTPESNGIRVNLGFGPSVGYAAGAGVIAKYSEGRPKPFSTTANLTLSAGASFTASVPLQAGGGHGDPSTSTSLSMKDLKFEGLGVRVGGYASVNSEFSFNINPFADKDKCK